MSDPALGLLMLGLIVVVIMLGFPTAFTLMGLGIVFGFIAFYDPTHMLADNRVFDHESAPITIIRREGDTVWQLIVAKEIDNADRGI